MRNMSLVVLILCALHLGVSAPQRDNGAPPKDPYSGRSQKPRSLAAMSTPQSVGDQIVKYFGRKTGKELMAEKADAAKAPQGTKTLVKEQAASAKTAASSEAPVMKPGYVPPPPAPRVSVPQIRQEIQRILELNQQIKTFQSGSSVQLQRVQEQARIHQKILNSLEDSQKAAAAQKAPVGNALLSQEKIRIIHEETQRNAQMIEALKTVPTKTSPKVTPKAKPTAS